MARLEIRLLKALIEEDTKVSIYSNGRVIARKSPGFFCTEYQWCDQDITHDELVRRLLSYNRPLRWELS